MALTIVASLRSTSASVRLTARLSRSTDVAILRISLLKSVDEGGDQIRRHQSLPEPTQNAVFKFVAAYQQCIRAGTL